MTEQLDRNKKDRQEHQIQLRPLDSSGLGGTVSRTECPKTDYMMSSRLLHKVVLKYPSTRGASHQLITSPLEACIQIGLSAS